MGYFGVKLVETARNTGTQGGKVGVVARLQAMMFDLLPHYFHQIKMRAVRRQEPDVQASSFPCFELGLDAPAAMQRGIVQEQDGGTHQKGQQLFFNGTNHLSAFQASQDQTMKQARRFDTGLTPEAQHPPKGHPNRWLWEPAGKPTVCPWNCHR